MVSYGACGMPYVIEGAVKEFQKLIERPADVFKKEYQIDVITNTCAQKIDRVKKEVYAIDLQSGVETIYEYDSLVVATGAERHFLTSKVSTRKMVMVMVMVYF